MKNILAIFLLSLLNFSCEQASDNENKDSKSINQDEVEILNTINNVYNNIIVESNKNPDFKTIKDQFVKRARLGYINKDSLILKNHIEYFDNMESMLSQNKVEYLKEWEIRGETKLFGNIAQRTSLYGVHFNTRDSLAEKGIINFQLVKTNKKWRILSMIWQAEKKELVVSNTYFD